MIPKQRMAGEKTDHLNPLLLLNRLDDFIDDQSVIVADGGDFVGSASYTLKPRAPLSWLDPGVLHCAVLAGPMLRLPGCKLPADGRVLQRTARCSILPRSPTSAWPVV